MIRTPPPPLCPTRSWRDYRTRSRWLRRPRLSYTFRRRALIPMLVAPRLWMPLLVGVWQRELGTFCLIWAVEGFWFLFDGGVWTTRKSLTYSTVLTGHCSSLDKVKLLKIKVRVFGKKLRKKPHSYGQFFFCNFIIWSFFHLSSTSWYAEIIYRSPDFVIFTRCIFHEYFKNIVL